MPSLIHSFQLRLAANRQRRERDQFARDLVRLISSPGKTFMLGETSISPKDLRVQIPEKLDMQPIPGNYGVAEVFIPCTISAPVAYSNQAMFWLKVKTVDGMITTIHITETQPLQTAAAVDQIDAAKATHPAEHDEVDGQTTADHPCMR